MCRRGHVYNVEYDISESGRARQAAHDAQGAAVAGAALPAAAAGPAPRGAGHPRRGLRRGARDARRLALEPRVVVRRVYRRPLALLRLRKRSVSFCITVVIGMETSLQTYFDERRNKKDPFCTYLFVNNRDNIAIDYCRLDPYIYERF